MPQVLTINKFYGGMSDSDAYTSDVMCAYQESVDGMSKPECLKLNRQVEDVISTGQGITTAQINRYYYTDAGEVYNSWGAVVYTLPSGQFYNAIKFGDNYIGFYKDGTELKLTQTPLNAAGTPQWWSTVDNYGINPDLTSFNPDVGNSNYCVAVNDSEDVLYFIGGNIVYKVLISQLPLITPGIVLEDDVVGITRQGQQISIYLKSGRKYFWDGFSEQHDGYIDLGQMIRYVYSTRNYDYVIAGDAAATYSKLFISQGQSFQLLRSGQFTLDGVSEQWRHAYGMKTQFGNFSMVANEKQVFIANSWMNAIESYGNRVPGLPQGSVMEARDTDWEFIGWFRYELLPDDIYFSVQDVNWNWFIKRLPLFRDPTPQYQESWVYYTKKFVMWIYKTRQSQMVVRYKTPTDTTIKIYVAVDWTNTYELLKTISDTSQNIKISTPSNIKQWYEYQYKIELESTDPNVTPELYNMTIFYDQTDR